MKIFLIILITITTLAGISLLIPGQTTTFNIEDKKLNTIAIIAENVIQCESEGNNVEIIDTNGRWSRGIAQFQDETWQRLSTKAGIDGKSTEPEKARAVLLWAIKNGYGNEWTCYRKLNKTMPELFAEI